MDVRLAIRLNDSGRAFFQVNHWKLIKKKFQHTRFISKMDMGSSNILIEDRHYLNTIKDCVYRARHAASTHWIKNFKK